MASLNAVLKTMKTQIQQVLEEYIGSQINLDSESARHQLADHIASVLENNYASKEQRHTDGCGYDD